MAHQLAHAPARYLVWAEAATVKATARLLQLLSCGCLVLTQRGTTPRMAQVRHIPSEREAMIIGRSPFAGSSDVDLFLVGLTPEAALAKLKHVLRTVKRNFGAGRVLIIKVRRHRLACRLLCAMALAHDGRVGAWHASEWHASALSRDRRCRAPV